MVHRRAIPLAFVAEYQNLNSTRQFQRKLTLGQLTWETSNERSEFFVVVAAGEPAHQTLDTAARFRSARSWQSWSSLLDIIRSEVVRNGRVESRLQKSEEEVEDVNSQGVTDNVPLFRQRGNSSD